MHQGKDFATALEGRRTSVAALSLRMAPVSLVQPHEKFQASRVDYLAERLAQEGVLVNPPIVTVAEDGDLHVVLDGATRVSAFRKLAYPHVVVQVVDVERDNVQLFAWNHVVRDVHGRGGIATFLELAGTIAGLRLVEMPIDQVAHDAQKPGALGYMLTPQKKNAYLLEVDPSTADATVEHQNGQERDWLDVLNDLVHGYEAWGDVERMLTTDMDQVHAVYSDAAALVVFPTFTPNTIVQLAAQGRLVPAGITRFVIPGRVLRLNAPLEKLASDESLARKQEWLDHFVTKKLRNRQVRYYEEPVVLLDE